MTQPTIEQMVECIDVCITHNKLPYVSAEQNLWFLRALRNTLTARKVPEIPKVVGKLFQLEMLATKADTINANEHNAFIVALCRCLQDHFEKETP